LKNCFRNWNNSANCRQGRIKWTRGPGQRHDREAS